MARDYKDEAYVAIPLETFETVISMLDIAISKLYKGRTNETMTVLENIKEEVAGYGN